MTTREPLFPNLPANRQILHHQVHAVLPAMLHWRPESPILHHYQGFQHRCPLTPGRHLYEPHLLNSQPSCRPRPIPGRLWPAVTVLTIHWLPAEELLPPLLARLPHHAPTAPAVAAIPQARVKVAVAATVLRVLANRDAVQPPPVPVAFWPAQRDPRRYRLVVHYLPDCCPYPVVRTGCAQGPSRVQTFLPYPDRPAVHLAPVPPAESFEYRQTMLQRVAVIAVLSAVVGSRRCTRVDRALPQTAACNRPPLVNTVQTAEFPHLD